MTSQARREGFPIPMSSMAENTYLTGLRLGYGPHDDAGMVRLYHADPLSKAQPAAAESDVSRSKDFVPKLLTAIHLAGVAEAVAFTRHLGLDFAQYTKLVNTAAGGSRMFEREAERMFRNLGGSKTKRSTDDRSIDDIVQDLNEIMEAAAQVRCPLFLGSEALNLFQFAKAKGYGSAGVECLVTLWQTEHR